MLLVVVVGLLLVRVTDCNSCGVNVNGMTVPDDRREEFYSPNTTVTQVPKSSDAGSNRLFRCTEGHQFLIIQSDTLSATSPLPIGHYHCAISDQDTESDRSFKMSFILGSITITPSGHNTIGEQYNLTCTIKTSGASTAIVWLDPHGVRLPHDTRKVYDNGSTPSAKVHSSILVFDPIQASDNGLYTCQITINGRSMTSRTETVMGINPVITAMVSGGTPTVGESYSLTCTVTGADRLNPTITYQWLNIRAKIPGQTQSTLSFSSLSLSDAGQYRCDVTVSSTLLSQSITKMSNTHDLTLQIPPPTAVTIMASPNGTIFTGCSLTLTCSIELSEAVDIAVTVNTMWSGPPGIQFNTTNSVATMMTATTYTSTATLILAEINDTGGYTCTAIVTSTSQFVTSSSQVTADNKTLADMIHMFQLKLMRTDDCITWNPYRAMEIQSSIHQQMLQAVTRRCHCALPKENLLPGAFSCLKYHNEATYRSSIVGTQSYTATKLVEFIQDWVTSDPTLVIQWYTVKLDPKCPVSISSLGVPECKWF